MGRNRIMTQTYLDAANEAMKNSLVDNLGIRFVWPQVEGTVQATMPVDHRTCQPFGMLAGGASLALAETLAGFGSRWLCHDEKKVVGVEVTGHHTAGVPVGESVTATGHILHEGKHTHLWSIDVHDRNGRLCSTERVLNYISDNHARRQEEDQE